jgi:hypothetical protein
VRRCACDSSWRRQPWGPPASEKTVSLHNWVWGRSEETDDCLELIYNRKSNETRPDSNESFLYARWYLR